MMLPICSEDRLVENVLCWTACELLRLDEVDFRSLSSSEMTELANALSIVTELPLESTVVLSSEVEPEDAEVFWVGSD